MDRAGYLANRDVVNFGTWLREGLDTNRSEHGWIDRSTREPWTCQSLRAAALNYRWPFKITLPGEHEPMVGHTLTENGTALDLLATGLRHSVRLRDDHSTLEWAIVVLIWGGVSAQNSPWLERRRDGLAAYLAFSAERLDDPATDAENVEGVERYNAGMTKIYALLLDSHIIYDSRVAAALALMVQRYCEDGGMVEVPEPLRFALPMGRVERNQRGPQIGGYRFPSVSGSNVRRTRLSVRSALYASWLLEDIVLQNGADAVFDGAEFPNGVSPLRALEAALFMVGNDVRGPMRQPLAM